MQPFQNLLKTCSLSSTIQQYLLSLVLCCSATNLAIAASTAGTSQDLLTCTIPTNCVNSLDTFGLSPLPYTGTPAQAVAALQQTLATFEEATVVQVGELTIEAVFTTAIGFRDTVTFSVHPQQGRIDFRSRSNLGLYDFGKNRSRMKAFSERYLAQVEAK